MELTYSLRSDEPIYSALSMSPGVENGYSATRVHGFAANPATAGAKGARSAPFRTRSSSKPAAVGAGFSDVGFIRQGVFQDFLSGLIRNIPGGAARCIVPGGYNVCRAVGDGVYGDDCVVCLVRSAVAVGNAVVGGADTVVWSADTVVGSANTVVPSANTVVGSANTVVGSANTGVESADNLVGGANNLVGSANNGVAGANTVVGSANNLVGGGDTGVVGANNGVRRADNGVSGDRGAVLRWFLGDFI